MVYLAIEFMVVSAYNPDPVPFRNFMKLLGWVSGSIYTLLTVLLILAFFVLNRALSNLLKGQLGSS